MHLITRDCTSLRVSCTCTYKLVDVVHSSTRRGLAEGIIAKCACSTNHTRIIFKNGISQGNYMVTKLPVQWYPRIFKSILNSSLTYIKCLDYLHFQASFSPVFFLLQVQGVSCDFCPEKVVCLGFIEGTFSNLSLQGRHFRGGKDREEGQGGSRREDRDKESQREGQGARGREREKRSRKEEIKHTTSR